MEYEDIVNRIILFLSYKDIRSLKCCNKKYSTFNYDWRSYFYYYLDSCYYNIYKGFVIKEKLIKDDMKWLVNEICHKNYVKYWEELLNLKIELNQCITFYDQENKLYTVKILTVDEWIDTLEFNRMHKDARAYIESKWTPGDKILINGDVEDGPLINVAKDIISAHDISHFTVEIEY
jgi:hypothetical protein